MSTSMSPSAVAMVNRQLEDLQNSSGVPTNATSGQGVASNYYTTTSHRSAGANEELQAVLNELRECKRSLLASTKALEQEKQAHAQTKELLQLALRPSDQTPNSFKQHPTLVNMQNNQQAAAINAAAAAPLIPDLDLKQQQLNNSPWRRSPRISPRRGNKHAGYGYGGHPVDMDPCQGFPPVAESSPLQELLLKAAGNSTPRKSAAETRRAVHDLCGVKDRHGNQKESSAFGSRTPRFQNLRLVGDHSLFQSSIPTGWADEELHTPNTKQQYSNKPGTPKRTVSPASSRRVTPRGPAGGSQTPTQMRSINHSGTKGSKQQQASSPLNENTIRTAAAEAAHRADESPAAPPVNPSQSLRSPDVSHWVHSVSTPGVGGVATSPPGASTPGRRVPATGGGLQYTMS